LFDKPRFLTKGILATVLIIPSSWGSQLGGYLPVSASKNKIKQNNNKVKDWKRETSLAKILFLSGNDARKIA
jgi:hypothetical protein